MGNIPFVKMHGLGNDFVLIDNRNSQLIVDKEKVQLICNRHSGVGCDQLLIIDRSDEADVYMKIFNPNGTMVKQLQKSCPPGFNSIKWDGLSEHSKDVANGPYIYHLKALADGTIFEKLYKVAKLK